VGEPTEGGEEGKVIQGGGVGRERDLGEGGREGGRERGRVRRRRKQKSTSNHSGREGGREGGRKGAYQLFARTEFLGWSSFYVGLTRFLGHGTGGAEEVEGEVLTPPSSNTQGLTQLAWKGGREGGREG